MNAIIYSWLRGLAIKYLNLEDPKEIQKVSVRVIQDLCTLVSVQDENTDPFHVIIPRISTEALYDIAKSLFGISDEKYSQSLSKRCFTSKRNAVNDGMYEYVLEFPFRKEVDITIEEMLVFEILYYAKYGERSAGTNILCCSTISNSGKYPHIKNINMSPGIHVAWWSPM